MISLIVMSVSIAAAFVGSAIVFVHERNAPSFIQLFGAGCLIVVVLAHVAERFHLFPCMGWGLPDSAGHYLDLVSAFGGLILFPIGYLSRRSICSKGRVR
jgi:hypothetical protein